MKKLLFATLSISMAILMTGCKKKEKFKPSMDKNTKCNIKIVGSKLTLLQGISLVSVWCAIIIASILLIKKK